MNIEIEIINRTKIKKRKKENDTVFMSIIIYKIYNKKKITHNDC